MMEVFKYLGINLTKQNSDQEEIKSGFMSGNACYHPVQNLLSSSLLSKNLKIIQNCNFSFCMSVKLGRSH